MYFVINMSKDISLVKGLSSIVNEQNVRPGINLAEIEKLIVSDKNTESPAVDTTFKNELEEYAKEIGIDFNTVNPEDSDEENYDDDGEDDSSQKNIENQSPEANAHMTSISSVGVATNRGETTHQSIPNQSTYGEATSYHGKSTTSELEERTMEQQRHMQIQHVIKEMGGESSNVWSIEKEKEEDMKATMLDEIDSLRLTLSEDDVNVDRIPVVTQANTFEEISAVHKTLRLKNDRTRYCNFAEEFLLFGAHGLEELFNGDNVWLGKYSPDLTGWHNHVQVKLRRMRHDTSTLVSGIMADYNIGPGLRIVLELIPSMFMYSKLRKQQFGSKKLYSDSAMGDAMNRIRNIDEGYDDKN